MIKIWQIPTEGLSTTSKATLAAQFKVEQEIMQLGYSQDQKLLAYLDSECSVGVVPMTPSLLSTSKATPEAEDEVNVDDIDVDEIDAEMLNDDDGDNIDMGDMQDALAESNEDQPRKEQDEEAKGQAEPTKKDQKKQAAKT